MSARARILKRHGNQTCTKHDWQQPWPAAVTRHFPQCGAWIVPALGGMANSGSDSTR